MENEKEAKVLSHIRTFGPVLPFKIAKELNTSILLASAILSGMVRSGKLKSSFQKIGSSQVYYLKGQEERALKMLHSSLNEFQKKFLSDFKNKKAVFDSDLSPRERIFIRELLDFIKPVKVEMNGKEEIFWRYYNMPPEEALKAITKVQKTTEKKLESKSSLFLSYEKPKKTISKREDIFNNVIEFLKNNNVIIIEERIVRKGYEYNLIIEVKSILPQKYYIKIKNKLRLNESDLSLAWMEGKSKNLPVIIFTSGKLTSKAEKFHKQKFGEFLKIFKV